MWKSGDPESYSCSSLGTRLIARSQLQASASDYLCARGFSDAIIAEVGWRVEPVGERSRTYGLPSEAAHALAWFIPYRHRNGKVAFERLRLTDDADLERFGGGKYRQPAGRSLALYDPHGALAEDGPLDALLLIEGEANAVAARMMLPDLPAVGLPGQGALKPELAQQLGHVPTIYVWLDRRDAGFERNGANVDLRLRTAGVGEVLFLEDSAGCDANEALLAVGADAAGDALRGMLKKAKPLPGADDAETPSRPETSVAYQPIEIMTARALCSLPDPPASDELLGPLLVRGYRTLLGADSGAGKTSLVLQLVKAVVSPGSFLEWSGKGGRALVIDAEQGTKTIKRRLREARLDDAESVHYLRVPDGLSLNSSEADVGEIEHALTAGGYDMVVADPLYKLHTGDSNAEREAVDLMRRFDAWRERFRFALVLVVHTRKPPPGARFTMHEFFGSSAYLRGAELVLGLRKVRHGYSTLHFFKDRDGDLPAGDAWGLLFDQESGFRRDPEDGKPKQTAEGKVRELLDAQPGMTEAQLIEASGYKERTVRGALRKLNAVGTPGPHNTKTWRLPSEQERLEAA
jgi:hypothetical protein